MGLRFFILVSLTKKWVNMDVTNWLMREYNWDLSDLMIPKVEEF